MSVGIGTCKRGFLPPHFFSWLTSTRWVNDRIGFGSKYRLPMNNFTNDWNDGRRICAMVDSFLPGLIPSAFTVLDL